MDAVVSTLFYAQCQIFLVHCRKSYILSTRWTLLFIEHVAAPKELCCDGCGVKPIWKVIGDGCNPDETWVALENAGFESVNCQHFQAPVPIVSPHIVVWQPRKAN